MIEAREAPLVLVYEDLHWADPTSRDLVAQLIDTIREARLLLIATARPGAQPEWMQRDNVTSLHLDRLTTEDVRSRAAPAVRSHAFC